MEAENDAPATRPLSSAEATANETITGYCFSCRAKKPVHHATMTRMANNRWAFTGTCVTCGKKMYKISAASTTEKEAVE